MKSSKTIAYFVFNTVQNGGNKVIFEHVNRLSKKGYRVDLYTIFGNQPTWILIEKRVKNFFFLFFTPYDILISTFWPTAWISLFIPAKRKIFFVLGWDEEVHKNFILRRLAKLTLKLPFEKIVISQHLKKEIEQYTKRQETIHVIKTYSIDTTVFKPNKPKKKKNVINILSVISRYRAYKGPCLLVNAVEKLRELHPNYKFTLVSLEKEPYANVFDYFFSNISIKKLARLYQQADILLTTSRIEGFYIPGLEAMSCGCLFITTPNGGISEYAVNKKNSVILKNIDELWKKDVIEKTWLNKKLVNTIKKNALITAKKYRWSTILSQLETIYNQ